MVLPSALALPYSGYGTYPAPQEDPASARPATCKFVRSICRTGLVTHAVTLTNARLFAAVNTVIGCTCVPVRSDASPTFTAVPVRSTDARTTSPNRGARGGPGPVSACTG